MRLTKSSASVLALCCIMLVSAASAAYDVTIAGGSGSSSANGGTAGSEGHLVYGAGFIDGQSMDNVLFEYIYAYADIPQGQIGDASAEYSTNGVATKTEQVTDERKLTVTLDGTVGVALNKASTIGSASAFAGMGAMVGMDTASPWTIGGQAGQIAYLDHSGTGSASAFTTGSASFEATDSFYKDYSIGYANGDMNIQGSNDKFGGEFSGYGQISTMTWFNDMNPEVRALTEQTEILDLYANRGISFSGDSNVAGSLNGQEMGETSWGFGSQDDGFMVDSEAQSRMNGMARALNVRDAATTSLLVRTSGMLKVNGNNVDAISNAVVDANASAERHMTGSLEKAQAEGFIDVASWTTSARGTNGNFSMISASQGPTEDGLPEDLQGFGVGAWILHPFNNPVSAGVTYNQMANTALKTQLENTFVLELKGMKKSGYIDDAVGAFGGVKDQFSNVHVQPITGAMKFATLMPADITAIDWMEGRDATVNHNRYEPKALFTATPSESAVARGLKLNYTTSALLV